MPFVSLSATGSSGGDGYIDFSFDDLDLGYDEDDRDSSSAMRTNDHLSSSYSLKSAGSGQHRPNSLMSSSTSNGTLSTSDSSSNSKKAFKLFKKDPPTTTMDGGKPTAPISVSVYDPDTPTMNFEDLIRSGNTMKVSLTPNRLRSIEIKDPHVDDTPTPTSSWERRSTSSLPRLSSKTSAPSSRAASPAPPPSSAAAAAAAAASPAPAQKKASSNDTSKEESEAKQEPSKQVDQAARPQPQKKSTPAAPTPNETPAKPSENPREAPKLSTTGAASSRPSADLVARTRQSLEKRAAEETSKQQPMKILRRSSMSNRKSRENLRRMREKEEQTAAAAADAPEMPALPSQKTKEQDSSSLSSSSSVISAKASFESVIKPALPSPPASENSSSSCSSSIKNQDISKESDEEEKKVRFQSENKNEDDAEKATKEEKNKEEPQRPSSIVAKRASMAGTTRRQSLHESYAVNNTTATSSSNNSKGREQPRSRTPSSTAGSVVEMSVKVWDELIKNGEDTITPAAAKRRSMMQQWRQSVAEGQQHDTKTRPPPVVRVESSSSSVLDKVMKFERASTLDDFAQEHHRQHRASSYIPRRERFLYLQREPGVLERRTTIKPRPITVDAEVQTDPIGPPALVVTCEDDMGVTTRKEVDIESERSSEHGMVDGDEEWFLQDDEWEDIQDQETAVVEWLLGEA